MTRLLLTLFALSVVPFSLAQTTVTAKTPGNQDVKVVTQSDSGPIVAPKPSIAFSAAEAPHLHTATLAAASRGDATGVTVHYTSDHWTASATPIRAGIGIYTDSYNSYETSEGVGLELSGEALSYFGNDPHPKPGIRLLSYAGLGPRLSAEFSQVDRGFFNPHSPNAPQPVINIYSLNVGVLGGVEARLQNFGIFLEMDLSAPAFTLAGDRFRTLAFQYSSPMRLSLGATYSY